jgi:DNA-binding CsgD family transcriptional regulator
MEVQLGQTEVSAIRRLLMAEPHPDNLLDDETLGTLVQLLPCDAIGTGEGDSEGYVLRGIDLPRGVHDDLGPQCCDGPLMTGIVQLASFPEDDPDVLFHHRIGVRDNLWIGFPTQAGTVVQLYLERRSGYFTPRDLAVASMLEPALGRLLRSRPKVGAAPLLTPTERRVLELVSTGASNREAAEELFVSVSTVRKHLEHSYRKLGVRSRTGALAAIS